MSTVTSKSGDAFEKSKSPKGLSKIAFKESDFILDGYELLDSAKGDLNLDEYEDMILILNKKGQSVNSNGENPEERPLLILTGQADKTYKQLSRNDNAVYCFDCGGMMGDPYAGLTIKNGYFSVEHYGGSGWRWSRIITYKYSKADKTWYLHKDGNESFHASEPDKVESKILTKKDFGKVQFEKFNIYEEK